MSLGAWLIGLEVEHIDDRNMCCGTPPGNDSDCTHEVNNKCFLVLDFLDGPGYVFPASAIQNLYPYYKASLRNEKYLFDPAAKFHLSFSPKHAGKLQIVSGKHRQEMYVLHHSTGVAAGYANRCSGSRMSMKSVVKGTGRSGVP